MSIPGIQLRTATPADLPQIYQLLEINDMLGEVEVQPVDENGPVPMPPADAGGCGSCGSGGGGCHAEHEAEPSPLPSGHTL